MTWVVRILDTIDSPADLRGLSVQELQKLAAEIRDEIVRTVKKTGGHLGANLGAVEIILAVHSVIDSPRDKLIFDVGHQAYPHKLVTGRRQQFGTLRQLHGLSGFPRMSESPHDAFGTGHAGTSISAALGYCLARDALGEQYKVVTLTGDGALTSGLSYEAMNHAGELKTDLVVVLNDNKMSIAPNVGAISNYLTQLRTDPTVHRAKEELERLIGRIPAIGGQMWKAAEKFKDTLRSLVIPGALFEEMGFTYYGPIDGHDIAMMQRVLREAISRGGPVLIHAVTEKGKGYAPAENDPGRLHALKPANSCAPSSVVTYSEVFGQTVLEMAREDSRIVAITAAMPEGTGLDVFASELPEQFFDVGIAEQHAVTVAAGMAAGGLRPVCAIYSTFMQRAYDQILHDVCMQNLPVVLCLDRGGLVGDDGPTHHGVYDLSFLRSIPNLVIMAPKDGQELRNMLYTAMMHPGPTAIRYPRGTTHIPRDSQWSALQIGKGRLLRAGEQVAILAIGSMVEPALKAAELLASRGIDAAVMDARFLKPIDEDLVLSLARTCGCLVTVEENAMIGGFGSAVLETLAKHGLSLPVRCMGVPDVYVEHGATEKLLELVCLTPEDIVSSVEQALNGAAVWKNSAVVR
ncbi:MAG: 1-deoxy-D-xylulose-5-phosphate synthase [Limnochordia bacterium]|jgi:1-deoxy-D-xylulose-5-phosphate synthase